MRGQGHKSARKFLSTSPVTRMLPHRQNLRSSESEGGEKFLKKKNPRCDVTLDNQHSVQTCKARKWVQLRILKILCSENSHSSKIDKSSICTNTNVPYSNHSALWVKVLKIEKEFYVVIYSISIMGTGGPICKDRKNKLQN